MYEELIENADRYGTKAIDMVRAGEIDLARFYSNVQDDYVQMALALDIDSACTRLSYQH